MSFRFCCSRVTFHLRACLLRARWAKAGRSVQTILRRRKGKIDAWWYVCSRTREFPDSRGSVENVERPRGSLTRRVRIGYGCGSCDEARETCPVCASRIDTRFTSSVRAVARSRAIFAFAYAPFAATSVDLAWAR